MLLGLWQLEGLQELCLFLHEHFLALLVPHLVGAVAIAWRLAVLLCQLIVQHLGEVGAVVVASVFLDHSRVALPRRLLRLDLLKGAFLELGHGG